MYGHQLIEDLSEKARKLKARGEKHYSNVYSALVPHIRASQHFFIGNVGELYKFIERFEGIPPFTGQLAEDVRLPYRSCFFSMKVDSSSYNVDGSPAIKLGWLVMTLSTFLQDSHPDWGDTATLDQIDAVNSDLGLVLFRAICSEQYGWFIENYAYNLSIGVPLISAGFGVLPGKQPDGEHNFSNSNCSTFPLYPPDVMEEYESKFIRSFGVPSYQLERNRELISQEILSINSFLMLLSCKNIKVHTNHPPEKLNKKRIKHGKQPLLSYKTLYLDLPAEKRSSEGQSEEPGEHNRLHLCRGHFKTYTEDKPLFGRIVGRWWWDSHVRGDAETGVVFKDYSIKGKKS